MKMIEEVNKRELGVESLMKFFELSKYDNSILVNFENEVNKGKMMLPES
jgi:hypothetical protein